MKNMEKKELLIPDLGDVVGGLTCNHDLEWCGQLGAPGKDGHYYQYNAWNCKKCNILRFTKMDIETKKRVYISAEEYFSLGGCVIF